jgi:hypothetical protein
MLVCVRSRPIDEAFRAPGEALVELAASQQSGWVAGTAGGSLARTSPRCALCAASPAGTGGWGCAAVCSRGPQGQGSCSASLRQRLRGLVQATGRDGA